MKKSLIFCIFFSISLWAIHSDANWQLMIINGSNFIKGQSYSVSAQFPISEATSRDEFVKRVIDLSFFSNSLNGYQVSVHAASQDFVKGDAFLFKSDNQRGLAFEYFLLCSSNKYGNPTPISQKGYCCPGTEGGTKLKNGGVIFLTNVQDLIVKDVDLYLVITHNQIATCMSGSYHSIIRLELVDF